MDTVYGLPLYHCIMKNERQKARAHEVQTATLVDDLILQYMGCVDDVYRMKSQVPEMPVVSLVRQSQI